MSGLEWNWTDAVSAIAQAALAVSASVAGWWAIYTYKKAKLAEAARWQKQIFDDFFLSGKFDAVRDALELDYEDGLGRILELSLQDRNGQLNAKQCKLLVELDNFLNLIEYVLYLEQEKRQIDENDRKALLAYWTGLISDPKRAALRHYAARYDYEKVAALNGTSGDTLLVLYGSLRKGQPKFEELGLAETFEYLGSCQFKGDLFDLGDFPGAVPGSGQVIGEIYKVLDQGIFAALDDYEEVDRPGVEKPLFVRRCIHVDGFGEAWVYLYNGSTAGRQPVPSGDWLKRQSTAE